MGVLRVEQRRGFAVEAEHPVSVAVCDRAGRLIAQCGDDLVTTFRSAAKPFQLEITFESLPESLREQVTSEDLALGAASHHAEPLHVGKVESLLERLGRGAEHLYCGAHPPSHGPSAEALFARGERPTALHNNCSGKHAFMAAAARAIGGPEDYRPDDHPLQRRILENLRSRTGNRVVGTVVDGCGLPCFVLPLSAMARAWAELACAMAKPGTSLGRIGRAMRAHPVLMSGTEAFDGWLIQNADVVAKVGAQGLLCMAVPEAGLGVAIKVHSGTDAVRAAATQAALHEFLPGVLRGEVPARYTQVKNAVGAVVGEFAAVWR